LVRESGCGRVGARGLMREMVGQGELLRRVVEGVLVREA
jgi:hypothetical protein